MLDTLYKKAGRPGLPVYPENIHWIPFRYRWEKEVPYNFPKSLLQKKP
jgi:hypothetical protein